VVFRSGDDDLPRLVHHEGTGAAGAYVDTKVRDVPSSKSP
jgi:hypothetical protein